jgi:PEP-CTERM motif
MKIGVLAAVLGVTLALGASASRAAIVESIFDTDLDTSVGSIIFPTFTGDSDAGVLFSYGGFTQAGITSISRSLDPTTDAVVALDLNARVGDNPCPNGASSCSNSTLNVSPTLAIETDQSCFVSGKIELCEEVPQMAHITFVPLAVPEPSTWAMMVVGLVGLGVAGRRSMRQAAGQTGGSRLVIPAQAGI